MGRTLKKAEEHDEYEWETHSDNIAAKKAAKAREKEQNSKITKYERRASRPDKYR